MPLLVDHVKIGLLQTLRLSGLDTSGALAETSPSGLLHEQVVAPSGPQPTTSSFPR